MNLYAYIMYVDIHVMYLDIYVYICIYYVFMYMWGIYIYIYIYIYVCAYADVCVHTSLSVWHAVVDDQRPCKKQALIFVIFIKAIRILQRV